MLRQLLLASLALFSAQTTSAQIYADVETTLGTFTIELDYENSPLAVANFIGLADGSKTWIDSATGAAKVGVPYYDGIIFHRVISGFMNQVGSQNSLGTDGPGYSFPDEFSTSDFSESYLVAMANSGPNSNGSQIFITVNPATHLNNVHTVFGSVPADDGAGGIIDGSRNVIDAINAAPATDNLPDTPIEIISVEIRRLGTSAIAFDNSSQALPSVVPVTPTLTFETGSTPILEFTQNPRETVLIGMSSDFENWTTTARFLDDSTESVVSDFDPSTLQTTEDRQFYYVSAVEWPTDATFPSSLSNQTLVITLDALTGAFTFVFDENGTGASWSYPAGALEGAAQQYLDFSFFTSDAYGGTSWMNLPSLNYFVWNLQFGLESSTSTEITGRTRGTAYGSGGTPPLDLSGSFSLSR